MTATSFSRLVALCGLTQQEAADFLGIAKKTVAMKAIGQRRATPDEVMRLALLWGDIKTRSLDAAVPDGARERATALVEAAALLRKHRGRKPKAPVPRPTLAPF